MKELLAVCVFAALVMCAAYFKWWRCGEMFPHAQVACFYSEH